MIKIKSIPQVLAYAALVVLTACQTSTPALTSAGPAKLSKSPTLGLCLKQIQSFIEQETGTALRLTDAAFATDDLLVISPVETLDAQGRPAQGRLRGLPVSYRLSKHHNQCTLSRSESNRTIVLDACACESYLPK